MTDKKCPHVKCLVKHALKQLKLDKIELQDCMFIITKSASFFNTNIVKYNTYHHDNHNNTLLAKPISITFTYRTNARFSFCLLRTPVIDDFTSN